MGLLDRLNQRLGASGQPAEDAGASAREEAQRAVGRSTQDTTAEAAAILAGKEPSRVAGGIFFFDADRMMVISEGGRFIQKQRAIRYDQLEAYALVQDGEILAQNGVSTISNNRPGGDDPVSEDCKAADSKAADMNTAGAKKHCVSLNVIMYFKDTSAGSEKEYQENKSGNLTMGLSEGNAPRAALESASGETLEQIEIPFITTKTKIGGFLYRTNRAPADQLIEALDLVIAGCR